MTVEVHYGFWWWALNLWIKFKIGILDQMLRTGGRFDLPDFILLSRVLILLEQRLLILLHYEKLVLSFLNLLNLLRLFLNLPLYFSVLLVSLNQLLYFALNIRIIGSIKLVFRSLVEQYFWTGHSVRCSLRFSTLWWSDCAHGLIGIYLVFWGFLLEIVLWRKVFFILARKFLCVVQILETFILMGRLVVLFFIFLILNLLVFQVFFTILLMHHTSIPIIELDFWFSINEHFLGRYWDHFCDFWGNLSFLGWTKESIVFDVCHIVTWIFFPLLVLNRSVISFTLGLMLLGLQLDSFSDGFDQEFRWKFKTLLLSMSISCKKLPDFRRWVEEMVKCEHRLRLKK